ncbi:DUF2306 domain-containing protein [Paucibacter sp. B2R-40]|uniref:DUF2306 domain-containing protein n=1 Tax=Paucibacter sp. B2R-40 TaxID=2893554 RepID=UPI0021E3AABC|nr:DUF2306 domain-containing protein [Paucibacter sp. B2R-40]MCV2353474.1 DUF2306 domain-containing protein [Paucibacter sp. B2R-40]
MLLFLSVVPVAAGAARLMQMLAGDMSSSARFMSMPGPVLLHIVAAALFCVLGAFQFDAALRRRNRRLHRYSGRLVAACGLLAALTGLWMAARLPIPAEQQGPLLYAARMLVGLCMAGTIVAAVRAVLLGRFDQHRAWMIRAYALGQGAGTQVLFLLPVALVSGAPTYRLRDLLMASAWGLNALVAEWLIRRRRRSTAFI